MSETFPTVIHTTQRSSAPDVGPGLAVAHLRDGHSVLIITTRAVPRASNGRLLALLPLAELPSASDLWPGTGRQAQVILDAQPVYDGNAKHPTIRLAQLVELAEQVAKALPGHIAQLTVICDSDDAAPLGQALGLAGLRGYFGQML